ncbi:dockerin type I domain-containing protein [Roseivirga misakiensis]|nr:dockerin type I domain-containing protein [Roseivirga misakiensis]
MTINFDSGSWPGVVVFTGSGSVDISTFDGSHGLTFSATLGSGSDAGRYRVAGGLWEFARTSGSITSASIESNDGSEFDLESISLRLGGSGSCRIDGFRDGSSSAVATTTVSTSTTLTAFSLTGVSGFDNVDKVTVTIITGATTVIRWDNLVFGTAAASDTDPPTFDVAPSASSVTTTGFTAGASIDEGGDIYYVVVADGATAPTPANVIAGKANGGGSPIASGSGTNLTDPFTLSSAVTGLTAGTAYDVYFIARDDESSPNIQATVTKVDVTTLAPSSLQIAATVFLEGAYNGTNLNTAINSSIPAQQPYNGVNSHSQTTSVSIPASAVDWVLVELREAGTAATATNATRKGSAAGFLMNDGTIKATNGTSNLTINLTGNTGTDYYVVIYHRNHLPIMSAAAIDGSGGTLTIDFTSNSANTYQTTTALASLTNNKFGMPSGDVNQDGSINSTDLSTWRTNNGAVYSYSGNGNADFNLDGEINAVDRNEFQQKNTSKTRQVPTT